jgi:hypothetical protein
MNLKARKLLAREILILFAVLTSGLIAYLCTVIHNVYIRNELDKVGKEIIAKHILADSLSKSYDVKKEKQNWYYDELANEYDLSNDGDVYQNSESLWGRISYLSAHDSIMDRFQNKWDSDFKRFHEKIGIKNAFQLVAFVKSNLHSDIDKTNNKAAQRIRKEAHSLNGKESALWNELIVQESQIQTTLIVLLISASLFFIFRYIFYLVYWSIKILRTPNDN